MITQQQIEHIAQKAKDNPLSESLLALLRRSIRDIHFTYCMDDDVVAAKPVYEDANFNLYLIDSRSHCLSFTQDMDVATGVVVAEIEEES